MYSQHQNIVITFNCFNNVAFSLRSYLKSTWAVIQIFEINILHFVVKPRTSMHMFCQPTMCILVIFTDFGKPFIPLHIVVCVIYRDLCEKPAQNTKYNIILEKQMNMKHLLCHPLSIPAYLQWLLGERQGTLATCLQSITTTHAHTHQRLGLEYKNYISKDGGLGFQRKTFFLQYSNAANCATYT